MLPLFFRRTLSSFLAAGSLALAAAPSVHAKTGDAAANNGGAPIDINFFYDTLKDDGTWYNTADYGDVWQPHIAYKSETWRPYTDGYWSYTDGGWMFVSNENFGWAVYHYGRWTRLKDIGWAWVPGTDWAPAWVTWRASKPDGNGPPAAPDGSPAPAAVDATTTTAPDASAPAPAVAAAPDDKNPVAPNPSSDTPPAPAAGGPPPTDNYIGWAPLPPERAAYTAIDYSYGPTVDVDFGIDPYDYCFTDVRYFGAPYIATVLFDPFQSYYCCGGSVNITNIYYRHDGGYRGFYAGGPNYDRFRGVTQHDIPHYNLRQEGGAAARAAIRNKQFNRIKGNSLGVPAPRFSPQGVGSDGRVKFTRAAALAKAEVNHGAPAAAASNPAYKQAQDSFAKQGNAYRAAHPDAPGSRAAASQGGATPETASKISTTPRAQEEERAARQTAGEKAPEPEKTAAGPAEARHEEGQSRGEPEHAQKEAPHEAEHPAETHAAKGRRSRGGGGGEGRRAGRQRAVASEGRAREAAGPRFQPKAAAPRAVAAPRPQGGGGGGGGDGKKKK